MARRPRGGATTLHALDVTDHVIEGWMVSQNKVLIHRQTKSVANVGHDLRLLDRINAQFAFQVLIEFDEVGGIARVLDHNLDHGADHVSIVHHRRRGGHGHSNGGCGRFGSGGRRFSRRRGGGRCRRLRSVRHALDVTDHVVQRWIVSKHEILVNGQGEASANIGHDLRLLDRVNAQFPFQVLVKFNKVGRITGVLDHDVNDRLHHRAIGRLCSRRWRRYRRGRGGGGRGHRRWLVDRRLRFAWSDGGLAFPRFGGWPSIALDAAVKVVVSVDIGNEFVLQNPHDHIVRSGQSPRPCQEFGPVDALSFNRPFPHQRQGDLGTETGGEPKAVLDGRVVTSG